MRCDGVNLKGAHKGNACLVPATYSTRGHWYCAIHCAAISGEPKLSKEAMRIRAARQKAARRAWSVSIDALMDQSDFIDTVL